MKLRKPEFLYDHSEPTDEVTGNVTRRSTFGWGWRMIYIFFTFSAAVYLVAVLSPDFADFINLRISPVIRAALAMFTNFIPFSLAETIIILIVPFFIAVIIIACHWHCGSWHDVRCFSCKLLSFALVILTVFFWGFGPGYHGSTLDSKLGIEKKQVSEAELKETVGILTELVNEASAQVEYEDKSFSVMPYSKEEMNRKLLASYDIISDRYDFIPKMYSRVKPVMLSEAMSYTHITGVYTFFTGEANINVNFPDYTIPFTAAHELAHQRGIAREDEANFVAFLVCSASDDAYIRYSGYLTMLEYLESAYYTADSSDKHADYIELYSQLDIKVRYEKRAYSEFFEKYRHNVAASVSGAVNDTYLKIHGTAGTASYGLVVDIAVAYYKNQNNR